MPPLTGLRPEWNEGCRLHNIYQSNHGIGHNEILSSPWYTPEGADAGRKSVLSGGQFLPRAAWEDAVYHRAGLLQPRMRESGYDASFEYTCMRIYGGIDDSPAARTSALTLYPWPADGLTDVPLKFRSQESPDPYSEVPENVSQLGFLLSVSVNGPWSTHLRPESDVVAASLTADGQGLVPVAVSDRDSPNGSYLDGGFGIFPLKALSPWTWYTARAEGTVRDGSSGPTYPFAVSWRFRTLNAPRYVRPKLRLSKGRLRRGRLIFAMRAASALKGRTAVVSRSSLRRSCSSSRHRCGWRRQGRVKRFRLKVKRRQAISAGRRPRHGRGVRLSIKVRGHTVAGPPTVVYRTARASRVYGGR